MEERELRETGDGSHTIFLPGWNEQYHSHHGAINEAVHVYIEAGLVHYAQLHGTRDIRVVEYGFGTGLNAWLTWQAAINNDLHVHYTAIEAYPVEPEMVAQLNFDALMPDFEQSVMDLHKVPWEESHRLDDHFTIEKQEIKFDAFRASKKYDVIYYDAFGPRVQPNLWTLERMQLLHEVCHPGSVLTTYCAKGQVGRDMKTAGFSVERIPGPPRKREMIRATAC